MCGNGRPHVRDDEPRPAPRNGNLLDKQDPLQTARRFLGETFVQGDLPTLAYSGDDVFYAWNQTAYAELPPAALRAKITRGWLASTAK